MILLNGLTVVIGLIIFHSALGMTLRANVTTRVPFYRNAQIIPGPPEYPKIGAFLDQLSI